MSPAAVFRRAQAAGKHRGLEMAHTSLPDIACKSPVVKPYLSASASQPVPEPRVCPAQVVDAGGATVVVVDVGTPHVGADAESQVMTARVVMFGIEVLHTSAMSCSWSTR